MCVLSLKTGSLLFISTPAYEWLVDADMVPRQIAFHDHTGAPSGLCFRAQRPVDIQEAAPKTPTDIPPPATAIDVESDTALQTAYFRNMQRF